MDITDTHRSTTEINKVELALDGARFIICLPDIEQDARQAAIAKERKPYSLDLLQDLAPRLQANDLVLDLGAGIGNHSLYLAIVVGCQMLAVERQVGAVQALRTALVSNRLEDTVWISADLPDLAGLGPVAAIVVQPGYAAALQALLDYGLGKLGAPFIYLDQACSAAAQEVQPLLTRQGYQRRAVGRHVALFSQDYLSVVEGWQIPFISPKAAYDQGAAQPEAEQVKKLRQALDAANQKYRTVTTQLTELKEKHALVNARYREVTDQQQQAVLTETSLREQNAHFQDQLQASENDNKSHQHALQALSRHVAEARLKYREATGSIIPTLKQKLEAQSERASELQARNAELNQLLKQARQENFAAQKALSTLRSSATYKAGVHVQAASRSLTAALKLPVRFWRLRRQSAQPVAVNQAETQKPILSAASDIMHAGLVTAGLGRKPSRQLRMACIMDDFTYGSYVPECELYQVTPQHWQAELQACQPELLFVESAWRGKDELWGNKIGHCSQELQDIVAWCRERHIPTVFWNKEDPVHFETFLTTAQLFDFVFTTDIDCIHRYKAALAHEYVYFLPFACQPAVHNPIEQYVRKDAFCFAGAYYVRYPERTRDLESFVRELPAYRPLEIYDRNYGKNDPNYQFPEAYQPHILGTLPFSEIDKAYRGYRYAINLNSIKQSQTMFARRVFELLGSNTLTISNFSRGVRLMLGDLVVTSDSGTEIHRRLQQLEGGTTVDRLRLAGLRKVMREHTYADRLDYILEKVTGEVRPQALPAFTLIALANDSQQLQTIIENVARQQGVALELVLVCGKELDPDNVQALLDAHALPGRVLTINALHKQRLSDLAGELHWIGGLDPADYYGAHYLLDLALATRYSEAQVIGKAAYFAADAGKAALLNLEQAYHTGRALAARRAVMHPQRAKDFNAQDWLQNLDSRMYQDTEQLAIDAFNYCEGAGSQPDQAITSEVDDLDIHQGIALSELNAMAEAIAPMHSDLDHAPWLDGAQFAHALLGEPFSWLNGRGLAGSKEEERPVRLTRNSAITARLMGPMLEIDSQLPDGKHDYLYAAKDLPLSSLSELVAMAEGASLPIHMQIDPGLNLSLVVLYLDADRQRLGHEVLQANRNLSLQPVEDTRYLRFGLRVYAGGSTKFYRLVLGHVDLEPANILGQSEVLLLTNHYPSYDDLYRNGFVHSRVKAYREHKVSVDIFRLRQDQPISWHEFQDIDVTTGSQQALRRMLASGRYRHVLVHFLDQPMWDVLKDFVDTIRVTVWVHGAEVQPWWRREYNYQNEEELENAKHESSERLVFWRGLLTNLPDKLNFVFVSRYFSGEVFEDVDVALPEAHFRIIHNPVDTDLFSFEEKSSEQRKRVLSIRPYATRKYANDLSVKAVLELSKEPFFDDLYFRFVGDGELFDEVLAPLRGFKNVEITRGFLDQKEIARLHKDFGIFLCPTRMDAQGVSKDEAMASGLIPVTNGVTAIPEFVDRSCGVLADAESHEGLALGIKEIYQDPMKFSSMSAAAASRARSQVDKREIVMNELRIFCSEVQ